MNGTRHVQLATSTDFLNWTIHDSDLGPLPDVGAWALQGNHGRTKSAPLTARAAVWAPSIIRRPRDGKYVLYYSAASNESDIEGHQIHCIGAAVSVSGGPAGPYYSLNHSIACPIEKGGAIDPYPFLGTDGALYVAWKVDGNSMGYVDCSGLRPPQFSTPIMLQKMYWDGFTPYGEPVELLNVSSSDVALIEAPAIVRSAEGVYFLFFSSGCTRTLSYNIKYATADKISGPYTRATAPLLLTGDWVSLVKLIDPAAKLGIHHTI